MTQTTAPDLSTATAHLHWDEQWRSPEDRAEWLAADPDIVATLPVLKARGLTRTLDLGCGVGRHALLLAREGFTVDAVDASPSGLSFLRQAATEAGVAVTTQEALMTALPYADHSFDYVLGFNVIYHGEPNVVRAAIAEIQRVLRPGGLYQGTMLSKRNGKFGLGRLVASDTYVLDDVSDKAHPHFYCNAAELVGLYAGFELLRLEDRVHAKPESWHWHLLAERR